MTPLKHNAIAWRIILYFSLVALVVSTLVAATMLSLSHRQQLQEVAERLDFVTSSYAESLGASLWFYDQSQLSAQIKGITNINGIQYVRVTDQHDFDNELGTRPHSSQINSTPLHFNDRQVGILEIAFNEEQILHNSLQAALSTLIAQLLSLFVLAIVLGMIVNRLFVRRISRMAQEVEQHRSQNTYHPLRFELSQTQDEITSLGRAFNALSEQINHELQQKIQAQQQLKSINLQLEERVQERTQDLQETIDELNLTLEQLHSTQKKLIDAEKLSALGGLVGGVAIVLNTLLGLWICVDCYALDDCENVESK